MPALQKIQDGFFEHLGSTIVLSIVGLLSWLFLSLAPAVAPVLRQHLSVDVLLAVLGVSVLLNAGLLFVVIYLRESESPLRLKFGILWDKDKNPHCPVCKRAGLQYGEWSFQPGYLCNPCNKTFALADESGKDLDPTTVIKSM
jgi:hypothetical protein